MWSFSTESARFGLMMDAQNCGFSGLYNNCIVGSIVGLRNRGSCDVYSSSRLLSLACCIPVLFQQRCKTDGSSCWWSAVAKNLFQLKVFAAGGLWFTFEMKLLSNDGTLDWYYEPVVKRSPCVYGGHLISGPIRFSLFNLITVEFLEVYLLVH